MESYYFWLAILGAALVCGCVAQSGTAGPTSLEFSSGPCDHSVDPYDPATPGVKESAWLDGTTLEVKAYAVINCAETVEGGDYEISGDKIILKYTAPPCNEICMDCMCAHELTYKFTNLENKEYTFELG